MSIVLVGYRGSGKTTIGKRLADSLWYRFIDTDHLIVQHAKASIRELFERDGEQAFRDIEARIVAEAMGLQDHVISLGGGCVILETNRQAIRDSGHKVIYLRCEPEELLRRIDADQYSVVNRPNLLGGGIDEIQALLEVREPLYRQLMTAELDVTKLSQEEATKRIARLV